MTFTNYIVLDFESFYSTKLGYTLKKMTPVEYLLDERFELIGCAVIDKGRGSNFHDPYWLDGADFQAYIGRLNERRAQGEKIVMLSHNALFDMSLLAWRFGFVPDIMVDTMGMSQALLAPKVGFVSLAKISEHLGIGQKGDTVVRVDGMTLADIKAAGLYQRYAQYSLNDAVLCDQIYQCLAPKFPRQEYLVKDTVLRCAVKPHFVLNEDILHEHLAQVRADKAQLLATAGVEVDEWGKAPALMSNDKFADLLRELGVEPPMKISLTTGKPTYAFAKADQGFAELLEHEDVAVQTLAAARVGVKSTIEESRTLRFISISQCRWLNSDRDQGKLPVALKYSGAHTHRLSGEWKLNLQNLPRGGQLRDALVAPPGYVVVTCDASQIEARIAAWLAAIILGEPSTLVEAFERGDDVYSLFASVHIYHRTITKADKKERFVGKQAILGLGFGMGYIRYMVQVRKDSRLQLNIEIILTEDESRQIVNGYRFGMAPAVPKAWRTLQQAIPLLQGGNSGYQFGPMTFGDREIIGPTGLPLFYPELEQVPGDKGLEWKFRSGRMHKRLFGGKLYENIVQHLARCCNTDAMLKVRMRTGVDLALQAHDELVYVVPGGIDSAGELTGYAKDFKDTLLAIMHERPSWGPTLPLAAEAGYGFSYGDAK